MGNMAQANELLGFVHAFYGLGATLAPTIATALITKAGRQWYEFYYIMAGGAALMLITSVASFWDSSGAAYRAQHGILPSTRNTLPPPAVAAEAPTTSQKWQRFLPEAFQPSSKALRSKSRTAEVISSKTTWLCALFLLVYCGIEGTISPFHPIPNQL